MPVDPQVAQILSMLATGGPPMSDATLADTRAGFALMGALGVGEVPTDAKAVDHDANGVPVRVYSPPGDVPGAGWPAMVFLHGGGWTIGSVNDYDAFVRKLVAQTDAVVVSVDYRLAPEHPFPAGVDDCYSALVWTAASASMLDIDPARIAVGGDSAGGNLSAVLTHRARDSGGPSICFQALIYPVTDCDFTNGSYTENGEGNFLETDGMRYFFDCYCRGGADPAIPAISPLRSTSFAALPPALVITAEFDPLRDEGDAYASALVGAGVAVEHHQYPGMIHGFIMMPAILDGGREGFEHVVRALRSAFGTV